MVLAYRTIEPIESHIPIKYFRRDRVLGRAESIEQTVSNLLAITTKEEIITQLGRAARRINHHQTIYIVGLILDLAGLYLYLSSQYSYHPIRSIENLPAVLVGGGLCGLFAGRTVELEVRKQIYQTIIQKLGNKLEKN